MEKAHTFMFDTPKGTVKIATNDLDELSRQPWFMGFFGVDEEMPRSRVPKQVAPAPQYEEEPEDDYEEIDEEALEKEVDRRAYEKAKELANQYIQAMEEKRREEEESRREAYRQQQEAQRQAYEQQAAQAQGAAAAQQAAPVPQQQVVGRHPSSFLDVPPDKMTNEMWQSLSLEQRKEYANKYMKQ